MSRSTQQPEFNETRLPCSRGWIVTLHESGRFHVIQDRCMRWHCEDCKMWKLGKKLGTLAKHTEDTVFKLDDDTGLAKRARRIQAGYVRMWMADMTTPAVVASASLFPDIEPGPVQEGIYQLGLHAYRYGVKRVGFNAKWRTVPKPEHEFITSSTESYKRILQAIADAGYGDMTTDDMDIDRISRLINHRLQESDDFNMDPGW